MDKKNVVGMLTEIDSTTSHTAIIILTEILVFGNQNEVCIWKRKS